MRTTMRYVVFPPVCVFLLLACKVGQAVNINATDDVILAASPSMFSEGFTKEMVLNCSFSQDIHSDFSIVMSLLLSKADAHHGQLFREIATISSVSRDNVTVKDSLGATATGQLNEYGDSFISLEWRTPSSQAAGEYQCQAYGMDSVGHPRVSTATTTITQQTVSFNDLLQKVKAMEVAQKSHKSQVDDLQTRLDSALVFNFFVQANYQGHKYYMSRLAMWTNQLAESLCRSHGGYMVEIDDQQEFSFVASFVQEHAAKDVLVFLGGRDKIVTFGGEWRFSYSGKRITYFHWGPNEPDKDVTEHCMFMNHSDLKMYAGPCSEFLAAMFICEIPILI